MTSQTGTTRGRWRRFVVAGVAGGAMVAGLVSGAATASAQPAEPTIETEAPTPVAEAPRSCTGDDCSRGAPEPAKINADQVLLQIYNEYAQGDGGGQVSKLIDDAVKLRRQGFRPSNANAAALADALERRPNQTPLVEALKNTIAYQRKLQAQAAMTAQQQGPVAGQVPVLPGSTVPVG
ncbi:hypothetical protein H7I53_20425 [Mycolicibacterium pulveris]|uniref:Secreted protein n=1 Tax=Mycolicibacterium pulveris TaxID=36813 RepID=A0A7I7USJ0_MYCPV|nr:hypothetical protein [Mycolicibacterium pulveris]MCV6982580.1 hypothetical protein [Mycolicibacterium pulveris]BBY83761.1 hypothetical protein MPUL_49190 [Mycolicibacterium pulveris]